MKFTETEITYLSGLQVPVPSGWTFSTNFPVTLLFVGPQSESSEGPVNCEHSFDLLLNHSGSK